MALEMKNRGVRVIAITNLEQSRASTSRHTSGKKLYELADVAIDNCVPMGDALISFDGLDSRTGASSTVAGAAIVHSIIIEAVGELRGAEKTCRFCPARMSKAQPPILCAKFWVGIRAVSDIWI
jgi:uncharacterized phosphosugar-binding protein